MSDEKERYEPQVFRDAIIAGLEDVGNNHDQLLKYLCDTATGKLDVKRFEDSYVNFEIACAMFVGEVNCLLFYFTIHFIRLELSWDCMKTHYC